MSKQYEAQRDILVIVQGKGGEPEHKRLKKGDLVTLDADEAKRHGSDLKAVP